MTRTGRIIVVTLGLVIAGAVFGALAGTLAFVVGVSLIGAPDAATKLWFLQLPAYLGAVLGAVTFPVGAWLLMRRVPLGLAILGTVLGTIVGGVIAWVAPIANRVSSSIVGGFVGFLLAAIFLWWRARAAKRTDHADESVSKL